MSVGRFFAAGIFTGVFAIDTINPLSFVHFSRVFFA
jgi:hypothetical protein